MGDELRVTLPAAPATIPEARRTVERFAITHGLPADRADELRLAVTEAVTNAVLHAYDGQDGAGPVDIACVRRDTTLAVVCRDHGSGMRPRIDSPGLGLGVSLMERSCDALQIRGAPGGGTEVRLVYTLAATA